MLHVVVWWPSVEIASGRYRYTPMVPDKSEYKKAPHFCVVVAVISDRLNVVVKCNLCTIFSCMDARIDDVGGVFLWFVVVIDGTVLVLVVGLVSPGVALELLLRSMPKSLAGNSMCRGSGS